MWSLTVNLCIQTRHKLVKQTDQATMMKVSKRIRWFLQAISSSSLIILNCFIVACRDESPTWVRQKRPAPPCQVKKTCMHQGGTTQVVSIILLLFAFVHVWAPNVWKTYPCIVFLFLGLSWFLSLLLTVFFHCTSICFADATCASSIGESSQSREKLRDLMVRKKE